ncbi:MAG: Lrp/AsnC family transcriptional regulator [Alphaproteobacteria bacterium]|nr:MAG: Lrp/AsnC family transcriptional regulator [Alphaproteobacteria bacterium]
MINENKLIEALDSGLDVTINRPFLKLAQVIGCTETQVIEGIKKLKHEGKIKRFGLIVKNRSIGFIHNAMVTLDVPDDVVDSFGESISLYPFVKLCYQRKRVLPQWRYNLYFMVHGKDRNVVLEQIEKILTENNLKHIPTEVLFSKQCLKQKGASYH